ncbi:MAG: hypothetical protein N0E54_17645, partial [Candidatus Thiodiazotropha taylori]|nr:hypothetical protein [Candidatus Thiodiazotropha endolucinida]MCW4230569.1 hypothetical protein [Candidatus Thiodiazotropha taylori]
MKGIFKTLVIGALAIQTALLVIPHFWPLLYDGQELDLITWHGFGSLVDLSGPIPYLVLIPYAVITYG